MWSDIKYDRIWYLDMQLDGGVTQSVNDPICFERETETDRDRRDRENHAMHVEARVQLAEVDSFFPPERASCYTALAHLAACLMGSQD